MKIQDNKFLSIEQLQDQYLSQNKNTVQAKNPDGKSFREDWRIVILNLQAARWNVCRRELKRRNRRELKSRL